MKRLLFLFLILSVFVFSCKEEKLPQPVKNISETEEGKNLKEFLNYLQNINTNKFERLNDVAKKYSELLAESDIFSRDTAFYCVWNFYNSVMDSLTNTFNIERDYNSLAVLSGISTEINPEKKKELANDNPSITEENFQFHKKLVDVGLMLDMEEGYLYVNVGSDKFIKDNFEKYLSEAMKSYIFQTIKERIEKYAGDGAIIIPINNVAGRIIWWENFISKYPDFFIYNDADFNYRNYLHALLEGLDNTPAFDYENNKLNKEFKEAYQFVMNNHAQTKAAGIVSEYYKVLEKNKFVQTNAVKQFIKKQFNTEN